METASRSRKTRTRRGRRGVTRGVAHPGIDAELAALAGDPVRRHLARAGSLAVTYGTRHPGQVVDDAALPFNDVQLLALSSRVCEAGALAGCASDAGRDVGYRSRIPLATYRPRVDLPGTGRITFAPEAVFDLRVRDGGRSVRKLTSARSARTAAAAVAMIHAVDDAEPGDRAPDVQVPRFYWAFWPSAAPTFEAAHTREAWAAAEVRIGAMRAWPAEMFARGVSERHAVHPVDGTPAPESDGAPGAEAGSWCCRGGVWYPKAQEPDRIYAYLSPMRGRRLRNPAFDVLRRRGLIPPGLTYRQWWLSVSRAMPGGVRAATDPAEAASPLGRLRARVEAYVDASGDGGVGLFAELADDCACHGVVDEAGDGFLSLLQDPATPAFARDLAAIQVVALTGPPGPETMDFELPAVAVPLYDLGVVYDQVSTRLVAEAGRQFRESAGSASPWKQPRPSA